jgi:hypothetical protein
MGHGSTDKLSNPPRNHESKAMVGLAYRIRPLRPLILNGISTGAPKEPRRKRAQPSEHSHKADVTGLELLGHRMGSAQRHQPGLLNRTATAAEVQGEAGGSGLTGAGMGQDHHAADGVAEERGGHGWMARNTGPHAPPQRPCQGAVGACVSPCTRRGGWGSAGVVLAPTWTRPFCSLRSRWFCRQSRPQREPEPYHSIRRGRLDVSISRFRRSSRLHTNRRPSAQAHIHRLKPLHAAGLALLPMEHGVPMTSAPMRTPRDVAAGP